MRISRQKWREKNPNYQKEYKLRDPALEKERIAEKNRRFKNANPYYFKSKSLEKYGITYDDYAQMYVDQGGKCKLCDLHHPLDSKKFTEILNVDHCHTTGKVRGLLCHKCNKALGLLHDNVAVLQRAIKYLGE